MADANSNKNSGLSPDAPSYVSLSGEYHYNSAVVVPTEFHNLYHQSNAAIDSHRDHTVEDIISSYQASGRWGALSPRTRKDYEKVLRHVSKEFGEWPSDRLKRKHLISTMEANQHRIRFANYIIQVTSILFEHGIDLGWVENNPAKGIRKLKVPSDKRKAHTPWPDWAVARFRAEAAPLPCLIFELGIGSVQRPGDWPRFLWSDFDGWNLRVIQSKTRHVLRLPCTERLKWHLDNSQRTGKTILADCNGAPFSYFKMARIMREERCRLGLLDYDLHALRYRGIIELARANCTDDEIASFSGHMTTAMITHYAGAARQEMRAKSAAEKRDGLRQTP